MINSGYENDQTLYTYCALSTDFHLTSFKLSIIKDSIAGYVIVYL